MSCRVLLKHCRNVASRTPRWALLLPILGAAVLAATAASPALAEGTSEPAVTAADPGTPDRSATAAPTVLNYQGRFTDEAGVALAGPVDLEFRLFTAASGGSALWTEAHTQVQLVDGTASVLLGSLVSFPAQAFSAPQRFLEILVGGSPLVPRLQIASAPFAMEADRLDGLDAAAFETAGEAAALRSDLATADGTPPNQGSNRVHWDNLNGLPAGFADAVDDTGSGVSDHGALEGLADDDHPQYALRVDLNEDDGTPPNQGSNRVHWDNLVGMPAGFADGSDDGSTGSGPVTGAEVVDSTLTGADVARMSLVGGHLAPGTVTGNEIALETVTGDNILDDSIRSADILDNTVSSADIKDGTIQSVDLGPGSVTASAIADGSVQPEDMGFLVGDITGVTVVGGLTGGGTSGAVTLAVGAGNGIQVTGSSVSLTASYFSGSAYDARFVSQSVPTWQAQSGAVAVAGAVFRPVTPTGKFTSRPTLGYLVVDSVNNVGAEDEFTAGLQLPNGAQITGFTVNYWDNSSSQLEVSLWRARQTTGTALKMASIITSGQSAAWQTGSDPTISETGVDTNEYVYWLTADFPPDPQGDNLRLLSVRVNYTITRPY
jgi:hypothetical protein